MSERKFLLGLSLAFIAASSTLLLTSYATGEVYKNYPFSGNVQYETDENAYGCQWLRYKVEISYIQPTGKKVHVKIIEWVDPENPPSYWVTRYHQDMVAGQNTGWIVPTQINSNVYVQISNPTPSTKVYYWGAFMGYYDDEG